MIFNYSFDFYHRSRKARNELVPYLAVFKDSYDDLNSTVLGTLIPLTESP